MQGSQRDWRQNYLKLPLEVATRELLISMYKKPTREKCANIVPIWCSQVVDVVWPAIVFGASCVFIRLALCSCQEHPLLQQ